MFDHTFKNGSRVILPEDPGNDGNALIFGSVVEGSDEVSGMVAGHASWLVFMLCNAIEEVAGYLDNDERKLFIRDISEVLGKVAKNTDGANVVMIIKGEKHGESEDD